MPSKNTRFPKRDIFFFHCTDNFRINHWTKYQHHVAHSSFSFFSFRRFLFFLNLSSGWIERGTTKLVLNFCTTPISIVVNNIRITSSTRALIMRSAFSSLIGANVKSFVLEYQAKQNVKINSKKPNCY